MTLRLNVGVSRKIGLPEFSSVGASCNIEVELDGGLLRDDLDGLHAQIQGAFVAAQQAVNDELARLQGQPAPSVAIPATPANGRGRSNGQAHANDTPARARVGRSGKPATPGQVKAIYSIARSQRADLEGLLEGYGVAQPEDLSLGQASQLIDRLKADAGG